MDKHKPALPDYENPGVLRLALAILSMVPHRSRITSRQVLQQLQEIHGIVVSERTVQRILRRLVDECGIECDVRDKPYGYRWSPGSHPWVAGMLGDMETMLIALARQNIQFLSSAALDSTHAGSSAIKQWQDRIRVEPAGLPFHAPKLDSEILAVISEAIFRDLELGISYIDLHEELHEYRVAPLGLIQKGHGLYLVFNRMGQSEVEHVSLFRIHQAHMGHDRVERPAGFKLSDYDGRGDFHRQGQRINLSFHIKTEVGAHLLDLPLHPEQKVTIHEDSLEIQATLEESHTLHRWLRGMGDDIWNLKLLVQEEADVS
ncbi:MAG: WYL domain-containing protein [Pseudomonadales bacterium]|nr:WYL domain-containing protein [Pseudomonadales bacterium]